MTIRIFVIIPFCLRHRPISKLRFLNQAGKAGRGNATLAGEKSRVSLPFT
jgi:hypothetical protein